MAASTRDRLVSVGAERFYRAGFQAVGLDEILDEVGITKTAFYKHFESKDDLIVAVLQARDRIDMEEWTAFMRARGHTSPSAELLAVFDLLHEWFARPDFRGCLFMNAATEFPSPNHPIHQAAAKHGENLQRVLHDLAARAGATAPGELASQLMLLVTGAIAARHSGGDLNSAMTAKATAEVLVARHCTTHGSGGRVRGARSSA